VAVTRKELVESKLLGYDPMEKLHLVHAADDKGRSLDLSDLEVIGENIAAKTSFHPYALPCNNDGTLSFAFAQKGLAGLTYRKDDLTLCMQN